VNAVRWQCKLHPARSARLINLLSGYGGALLLICFTWHAEWHGLQALLPIAVLAESWRNERLLLRRCGELTRDGDGVWCWQGVSWYTVCPEQWLPWGVLLTLRNAQGKRWRLWLMCDAMPSLAWRQLRAHCALSKTA